MSFKNYSFGALLGVGVSVVATKYSSSIDWFDSIGRSLVSGYPFPIAIQAATLGAAMVHGIQLLRGNRLDLEGKVEAKH